MNTVEEISNLFDDKELIKQALTHKSWVNEHPKVRGSNERLEFLGDAVLEFIISKELYSIFPEKEEGYLTALRANLVNTQNLASLASKLKIGDSLFLSKGEEDGGGRENPSLLADTMEAIIGALYLDQGLEQVSDFIKHHLVAEIPDKVARPLKDPKSLLQELVQSKGFSAPRYKVLEESGPDHNKRFVIEVLVDNHSWGKGEGRSKNVAEQAAAKEALKNSS